MKLLITTASLLVAMVLQAQADHVRREHRRDHHRSHLTCATIFDGENFSGARLEVRNGQTISDLSSMSVDYRGWENWDNKVSSISVERGCRLTGYQFRNFNRDDRSGYDLGGWVRDFSGFGGAYGNGDFAFLRGDVTNKMSSLQCSCR